MEPSLRQGEDPEAHGQRRQHGGELIPVGLVTSISRINVSSEYDP